MNSKEIIVWTFVLFEDKDSILNLKFYLKEVIFYFEYLAGELPTIK